MTAGMLHSESSAGLADAQGVSTTAGAPSSRIPVAAADRIVDFYGYAHFPCRTEYRHADGVLGAASYSEIARFLLARSRSGPAPLCWRWCCCLPSAWERTTSALCGWHVTACLAFFRSPPCAALGIAAHGAGAAILLALACAVLECVAVDAFWIEPRWLQVTYQELASRKLTRPVRAAIIADLQTDQIGAYERSVLARVMAEEPDLILLAGDYLQEYNHRRRAELAKSCARYSKS